MNLYDKAVFYREFIAEGGDGRKQFEVTNEFEAEDGEGAGDGATPGADNDKG